MTDNAVDFVRGLVNLAQEAVDDLDLTLGEYAVVALHTGGEWFRAVKAGLEAADAYLANLPVDPKPVEELSVEEKLAVLQDAGDLRYGPDGHFWGWVNVSPFTESAIEDAYEKFMAGTLWD